MNKKSKKEQTLCGRVNRLPHCLRAYIRSFVMDVDARIDGGVGRGVEVVSSPEQEGCSVQLRRHLL